MAITQKHLMDYCYGGTLGAHCKYLLDKYTTTSVIHVCTKHAPKAFADLEKSRGKNNPWRVSLPMADNCDGYPLMLYTPQGVDVDKK